MPYDIIQKGDAIHEDMQEDAMKRRNLTGTNLFENLGDPIKQIILQVEKEGKDVDDTTLELLQHITVKQLAKIFDMLGAGEDAQTILAWLKRRARKNKEGQDDWKEQRKKLIATGADKNPIEFYKAIEAANAAKQAEYDQMAEERAQLRLARAKTRDKEREAFLQKMEDAKKAMEDEGQFWKAHEVMPEKDKNAINNAFEKFASKNSDFDNTEMDQDGEWWKRDPYRRDWERNKGKGKKWTAVCEGAKDKATDPELAVREEFYRGNDWWKADKYKNDWEGTKDASWWKEEPYIKDWHQNKHEGARWTAADEESGLESEGHKYPCSPEEARHREEWYKANGPRGVVKKWNAATEGDPEKCSVPEKHAREEFYRNGDWWKTDDARHDFRDKGLDCEALTHAAKPLNTDWWKQEPYRSDFFKNGPNGKQWTAINEGAAVDGLGDKKPAPAIEKQRREAWYRDNWWKQPDYKEDWKKNGRTGVKWRAPTEEEAKSGTYPKPIGDDERRKREEWYKNADEEWWKAPQFIEDYFQKGHAARHWPAKTKDDGIGGRGLENPASRDERGKREEWYRANWWKQPKYTDDYWKNGALGAAWTGKGDEQCIDKEWWKQAPFIENWRKTMKPKSQPEGQEWWKQPEYVEDYHTHGPEGKKWQAATETAGVESTGHRNTCAPDDKDYRQRWYNDNWWRAPKYSMDWAKNGGRGELWRAESKEAADDPKVGALKKPCTEKEGRGRVAFYKPIGDMWRACSEEVGFACKAQDNPCTSSDALKRDEWYRTNWWKAPEYIADWNANKGAGKMWPAGCEASGKASAADQDPCCDAERQRRDDWYRNYADNSWWKEPQYCEDWGQNGPDGLMWTADNRQNANRSGGKEHPCPPQEKKDREDWYNDNWWKTPHCYDDWKKHGKDGPECGRERPAQVDRQDPETVGDGWWKKPEYIDDWLKNDADGKHWTAADPLAAASGMGHKKPAEDAEKAKREKWYRDNWWKAPTCSDEWAKAGHNGTQWTAATPDDTRNAEGDKSPASQAEKDKREDWYRKHGDSDDWWKRPEFIGDYQEAGPSGKKWTAGNPTAGALGLGQTCPASGPQKKKREDWYKDNWWKAPKYSEDWAKGPQSTGSWKDGATPAEEKYRDAWYRHNKGTPASPEEKDKRDAWFRKHPTEPSGAQIQKREDWYRGQLSDDDKAKRMDWLRDRGSKDKRILADELADALAAINEGQPPTEQQVKAVMDAIQKNRDNSKDDFSPEDAYGSKRGVADEDPEDAYGSKRGVADEEPTITREEFFRAVADTNFYVPPDKDELEMQAEEERIDQEKEEMARQEEELAYLAMDAEEEQKKRPVNWQRKYVDPKNDEWWKRPDMIENYHKKPEDEEAEWRREAEFSKDPATDDEVAHREEWYKNNWWKDPKYSTEWRRAGEMGENWKKAGRPDEEEDGAPVEDETAPEATDEQIAERERWYRNAKAPERQAVVEDAGWKRPEMVEDFQDGGEEWKRDAKPEEIETREKWMKQNWWKAPKHIEEFKKAAKEPEAAETATWKRQPVQEDEEVPEATPEEVKEREDYYKKVLEPFEGEKLDEPFVGEKFQDEDPFKGEKLKDEEPFAGEKLKDKEPFDGEKLKDKEPFDGEKLKDEEPFDGEKLKDDEPFDGEKLKDEDPFDGEKFTNEDDAPDDPEWEEPAEEMQAEDERVEEEPEEEEKPPEEEENAWNDDDDEEAKSAEAEEEEEEDEGEDNEHQDDEDLEAELEAALEEQEAEWEEDEDEEENQQEAPDDERKNEYDEDDEEPEKPPEPYILPLPEITNNIYLKSYFPVLKWNPSKKYTANDRRVWVVDHFSKSFYCLDGKGKLKKSHDANKLLQLERNIMDPRRARLMFFDAPKSYEIVFPTTEERERFYETGMSIRPAIRVYAPSLTKPDTADDNATSTTTTIDGVKENSVVQKVPNPFKKTGELVDRELTGRCKINSSKVEDEPVSVWTGSFNMCGATPPKDSSVLEKWCPRNKYDIYAFSAQECSWQKEEGEWFAFVQSYLGKDYLTLASMQLWDITIVVLCRKKNLLKITNVEGSTKATLHKEKCGMKGAAGISLKVHNTSMAFVSCHLAARLERNKMRRINIEEIASQIQLANKDCDISTQFHHVFWMGDMNYRVEMEAAEAEPLIASKNWLELLNQDQLLTEMREVGLLHGFKEAPITFAPTYRYNPGSNEYMKDRGRAPSYTDRILVKSMRNAEIKKTGYGAAEEICTSEHKPIFATFVVKAIRPHMCCFHRDQEPRPQFEFMEVTFTEQTHLIFKKAQVLMYTPFSENPHKGKIMAEASMMPSFTGDNLPEPIKCVVQMTEYLEKNALIIIFRDTSEPREDKMFRGAAVMELDGRVEPYDEVREDDLEVLCLSRKVGTVHIKYKVTNYGYTPPPGGAPGRIPDGCNMDGREAEAKGGGDDE